MHKWQYDEERLAKSAMSMCLCVEGVCFCLYIYIYMSNPYAWVGWNTRSVLSRV